MRVLQLLHNTNIIQLNIQILIDTLQRAPNLDVVLELDCDFMVDEGLEEATDALLALILGSHPIQSKLNAA